MLKSRFAAGVAVGVVATLAIAGMVVVFYPSGSLSCTSEAQGVEIDGVWYMAEDQGAAGRGACDGAGWGANPNNELRAYLGLDCRLHWSDGRVSEPMMEPNNEDGSCG